MRQAVRQQRQLLLSAIERRAARRVQEAAASVVHLHERQVSPAGCLPSSSASTFVLSAAGQHASKRFYIAPATSPLDESGPDTVSQLDQHGVSYSFETNNLAPSADGSCLAKLGNTWVLATVTASEALRAHERIKPNLTVEYREPLSGVGKMPGGRFKTEGAPNDREVDTALLVEKAIMPMFAPGYTGNVTVNAIVLCSDGSCEPAAIAISAVSAALMRSDIPWQGPIAAVQFAHQAPKAKLGDVIIQPSAAQLQACTASGLYVGSADSLLLADFQGNEVTQQVVASGLQAAKVATAQLLATQHNALRQQSSRAKAQPSQQAQQAQHTQQSEHAQQAQQTQQAQQAQQAQRAAGCDPAARAGIVSLAEPLIRQVLSDRQAEVGRQEREEELKEAKESVVEQLTARGMYRFQALRVPGSGCATQADVDFVFQDVQSMVLRDMLSQRNVRCDGRGLIDARPASYQVGLLPVVHGSALGVQGGTQVLVTGTIGQVEAQAKSEGITGQTSKQLMVHLNDRVSSAAEASTVGRDKPSSIAQQRKRRHIERLIESGLATAFPADDFPFAVRLNVDLLASNGSEAMVALSAALLATADAGVPIRHHVAGAEVAAFTESGHPSNSSATQPDPASTPSSSTDSQTDPDSPPSISTASQTDSDSAHTLHDVMVDPQAIESNFSDLLLQVMATEQGITGLHVTALQRGGVALDVVSSALSYGWQNLQQQHSQLAEVRAKATRSVASNVGSVTVPKDKLGKLIGAQGSTINRIRSETGSLISISESEGVHNAVVHFFCPEGQRADAVEQAIRSVVGLDLLEGSVHTVKVARLMDYGAIVNFPNGSSTLLHISQISHTRVNSIEDILSLGQQLQVKVMGHDNRGNLQISHKALTAAAAVGEARADQPSDAPRTPQTPDRRAYQATNVRFRPSSGRGNQKFEKRHST